MTEADFERAIIVFAHGSSVESANEAVRDVAGAFEAKSGFGLVQAAFLEKGEPDLAAAAASLAVRGARRIVVLPYFLTLGIHLQRDLPRMIAEIEQVLPDVRFEVAPPLDGHDALVEILLDRAKAAVG